MFVLAFYCLLFCLRWEAHRDQVNVRWLPLPSPSEILGLLCQYVLDHRPSVFLKCQPNSFAGFDRTWGDGVCIYFCTLQIWHDCLSLLSHHDRHDCWECILLSRHHSISSRCRRGCRMLQITSSSKAKRFHSDFKPGSVWPKPRLKVVKRPTGVTGGQWSTYDSPPASLGWNKEKVNLLWFTPRVSNLHVLTTPCICFVLAASVLFWPHIARYECKCNPWNRL